MRRIVILLALYLLILSPAAAQSGVTWRAEYYANPYLVGGTKYVQQENAINFDWGLGAPDKLPKDNFSIRFISRCLFRRRDLPLQQPGR